MPFIKQKAGADRFRPPIPFVQTDTFCPSCVYILNNEKKSEIALFLLNFASFLMLAGARGNSKPKHPLSGVPAIGICFATILPDRQPAHQTIFIEFFFGASRLTLSFSGKLLLWRKSDADEKAARKLPPRNTACLPAST